MIFEILFSGISTLVFIILYLNIKLNSVKTVGICNKVINATRGCKGMFEYQIDGIKYYNVENSAHIGWLKKEKKYSIYVKKNNYNTLVSNKVIVDYMFFIIIMGSLFLFFFYAEFIHK